MDQGLGQTRLARERVGGESGQEPPVGGDGLGALVLGVEGAGRAIRGHPAERAVRVGLVEGLEGLLGLGILAVLEQLGGGEEFRTLGRGGSRVLGGDLGKVGSTRAGPLGTGGQRRQQRLVGTGLRRRAQVLLDDQGHHEG